MIGAFEFGNFHIIGKANTISQQLENIAASRGQYWQWRDEQAQKAQSSDTQIISRRGQAHVPANSTGEA
jgi:hypothetical protein